MKFYIHLLISSFILSSSITHSAQTDAEIIAMVEAKKAELITMKKSLNMKGSVRSRKVSFSGTMDIANAVGEEMELNGKGLLENCKIENYTTLNGEYIITDSALDKVHLNEAFSSFNNCTLSSITAKGLENQPCIIELLNTIVEGDIVFEGKPGIIVINDKSQLRQPVINGTIIKK